MIKINGADKMENSMRLFVPTETDREKIASNILINGLSEILEGFTIMIGKGVYRMKSNNSVINESNIVIDIMVDKVNDNIIKDVFKHFKQYGINAHEETIMFNMDGITYISKPEILEVV